MRFRQLILYSLSLVFVFSFFQYSVCYSIPVGLPLLLCSAVGVIKFAVAVIMSAWRSRGMPLHAIHSRDEKSIFISKLYIFKLDQDSKIYFCKMGFCWISLRASLLMSFVLYFSLMAAGIVRHRVPCYAKRKHS